MTLDYLREKEKLLREEKNIKLREKERNQLMIGVQRILKREQLDTSGN